VRISGARYAHDYLADLCPNQNLFWSLSDVRLTNPIILETYADFAQHWNTANIYMTTCYLPRQNAELMRFLGVRWTVRDAARPDPDLPVRRIEGPLALQEVEGFRPWARLVSGWEAGVARPDELALDYTQAMMAFLLFQQQPRDVLMIGLGGGSMARYMHQRMPRTRSTVVEINPKVLAAARSLFHFPEDDARLAVAIADGAVYLHTHSACTDVLLVHAQEGGDFPESQRPALEAFLKRGGGLVLIHASAAPTKQPGRSEYLKSIVGGSWVWGQTKWLEGPMSLYYVDRTHPITQEIGRAHV